MKLLVVKGICEEGNIDTILDEKKQTEGSCVMSGSIFAFNLLLIGKLSSEGG
jgi:hypothetical protein